MATSDDNAVKLAVIEGRINVLEEKIHPVKMMGEDINLMKIDIAVIKKSVEAMLKIWWLIISIVATTVIGALLALIIVSKAGK